MDEHDYPEKLKDLNAKCEMCNGHMVLRTGRIYGSQFLGCSNYPKCTYTCSLSFNAKLNSVLVLDPEIVPSD